MPLPEPDLIGRTLLHFHVVERLGAGGMGVVYRAIDEKLRRPVALKVLSARSLAHAGHRETLFREARSAAAVNHPSIASVYEVHDGPEGSFFVMEFVEGETLRARLSRAGALPLHEALRVALGIAEGLALAHRSSVVHRDLKCENVMLTREGRAKLLDFGLASVQGTEDEATAVAPTETAAETLALAPTMPATATPTTGGRVAGTPASMSPEQARGEAVDARADVYGFGVVLYEMLSGRPPFPHRSRRPWEWDDEGSAAWTPARPLREVAPSIPRQLEQLVAECLSAAKDDRPRDGTALVSRLEPMLARRPGRFSSLAIAATATASAVVAIAIVIASTRPRAPSLSPAAPVTSAPVASLATRSAAEPVMRALTTETDTDHEVRAWAPLSVSGDAQRILYVRSMQSSYRIHDLRSLEDEVLPSPDGSEVVSALFLGEGPTERIAVQTMKATWCVHPVTKETWKIVDDPLQIVSMSTDGRYIEWLRSDRQRNVAVFGRTETATRAATTVGELHEVSDTPMFWLSPDGSLLASVAREAGVTRLMLSRSESPLDAHEIMADKRLTIEANHFSIEWLDRDRLVLCLQEGDPPSTNLWQQRIDPVALRALGPPEPLTHWEHVNALRLRVHHAAHAISFTRAEMQWDVSLADVAPRTRRLSGVRRLTLSDTDEVPGAWTLDGQKLLFVSNRTGHWGIYLRGATADALERPVVTGPVNASFPQLVLDDTALLYWSVPADGPPSIVRAPFPGTNAPAETLFVSPDRERWSFGTPLPFDSRFVCARRTPDCVLLSFDSSTLTWSWYHLDPRDGALRPLEGLPQPDPLDPNVQISPDGGRLALIDRDRALDVFELGPPLRRVTRRARTYLSMFDADGRGVFHGPVLTLDWAPALRYLGVDGRETEVYRPYLTPDVPDGRPSVSPDGSRVAFMSRTESWNLWILEHAF